MNIDELLLRRTLVRLDYILGFTEADAMVARAKLRLPVCRERQRMRKK